MLHGGVAVSATRALPALQAAFESVELALTVLVRVGYIQLRTPQLREFDLPHKASSVKPLKRLKVTFPRI